MAIRAEAMHNPPLEPILERLGIGSAMWLSNAAGIDLHQTTGLDQSLDLSGLMQQFFLPLRVGQNRPHTLSDQAAYRSFQVEEAAMRHLDQQITASIGHTQKTAFDPGRFDVG